MQRAGNARDAGDRMKLHRRTVRLAGRDHTVIGLRPATRARFSTNVFHETPHVLSDQHGARVLARLLWGLSYQSRPGTLLVIDRPFLAPTPFDADPADPIVLVPAWHTPFTARTARDLARRLPLRTRPDGTVRWHTRGLDAARGDERAWFREHLPYWTRETGRVERLHGCVALMAGSPEEMRGWAVRAAWLRISERVGMDYDDLGAWERSPGEVQIFRDFRRDVGVARLARAEVLAEGDAPADPGELRPLIWRRHGAILRGRDRRIANGGALGREDAERLAAHGVRVVDDLAAIGAASAYRLLRDPPADPPADSSDCGADAPLMAALEALATGVDPEDVEPGRVRDLLREAGGSPE